MRSNRTSTVGVLVVVAVLGVGLSACRTAKRTFVVTTTVDAVDVAPGDEVCATAVGDCSLRAAVQESNALPGISAVQLGVAQTYVLDGVAGEDVGAVGDLDVIGDVILTGNGSTITATADRVLDVPPGGRIDVKRVTLRGAGSAAGGSWVAEGGGVVRAGGIFDATDATLHEGHAASGGAVLVSAGGTAQLRSSTVAGNAADVGGAGLAAESGAVAVTLTESTVAGNVAPAGAALAMVDGSLSVTGSILGEPADGPACALGAAVPVSGGGNVTGDGSCALTGPGDVVGHALLAPLAPIDGALVRAPGLASAALDAGPDACAVEDQRRRPRPVDADADGIARCDAGAFEAGRSLPVLPAVGRSTMDPEVDSGIGSWHNIAGRNASKSNGDRTSANSVGSCFFACSATGNLEFDPGGKVFEVEGPPAGGPLRIDVYDPAYTYNGDRCEQAFLPSLATADFIATVVNSMLASDGTSLNVFTPAGTRARRYVQNDTLAASSEDGQGAMRYCPGDQQIGSGAPDTTYLVLGPTPAGGDADDAPILCHVTFTGRDPGQRNYSVHPDVAWTAAASPTTRESGFTNAFVGQTANTMKGFEFEKLAAHYHRWYPVCRIASATAGTYRVVVRTNADLSSVPMPDRVGNVDIRGSLGSVLASVEPSAGGLNRFGLRAGYSTTNPSASPAPVAGVGASALYIGVGGYSSPTTYDVPAVRVSSADAGRQVELELWDIGDIAGCCGVPDPTASLEILGPDGSAPLTCTFERDHGPQVVVGVWPVVAIDGCTISGLSPGTYNGHLLTARLDLPPGFTCADADPDGCVVRIRWTSTGDSMDTTTISARIR